MQIAAKAYAQQTLAALQPEVASLGQQDQAQQAAKTKADAANSTAQDDFGPSVVVNLSANAVQALGQSEKEKQHGDNAENSDGGNGNLTDAQGFGDLIARLAQIGPQSNNELNAEDDDQGVNIASGNNEKENGVNITANANSESDNGVKVENPDEGEGDDTVVSAQVEQPDAQGETGANILAAANNQEQANPQNVLDLFDNNDDQKKLS